MELETGLQHILDKAKRGIDLNSHLSKSIRDFDFFDFLQLDWGIMHIHLGVDILKDGMAARTKELLYVFPKEKTLYCIDILSHRDFANIELLEIMNRNWPDLIPKLNGISPDTSINTELISKLRKAGVNYAPSLADGSVIFSPGGGVVAGGFSANHIIGADHLEIRLKDAEQAIKKSAAKICKNIRLRTGSEPKRVKLLTVQINAQAIIMREVYSGLNFAFNC